MVCVRSAASFLAVRTGLAGRMLDRVEVPGAGRVLLVCGSHTEGSTQQLDKLRADGAQILSLPSEAAVREDHDVLERIWRQARRSLMTTRFAVIATERRSQLRLRNLAAGAAIMGLLTSLVERLRDDVDAVIAKGGITSAEVARTGLAGDRARYRPDRGGCARLGPPLIGRSHAPLRHRSRQCRRTGPSG